MPETGEPIARGRAADIFAHGDGLVLRRYRSDFNCQHEAAVMQHVAAHGYPVPAVVSAQGRDLVMERLDGHTMLADFSKHPWLVRRHAATIAGLFEKLHEIPIEPWMIRKHPTGETIVHLDLHPDNVMLTSRGPVVIDWSNAGIGDGDAEVADLWLLFTSATVPGSWFDRALAKVGRSLFVNGFLRHFDRDALRRSLPLAFENRSRDRNMSEAELGRMRKLVESETT